MGWLLSVNETVRVVKDRVGEFYQTEAELLPMHMAYWERLLGEGSKEGEKQGGVSGDV